MINIERKKQLRLKILENLEVIVDNTTISPEDIDDILESLRDDTVTVTPFVPPVGSDGWGGTGNPPFYPVISWSKDKQDLNVPPTVVYTTSTTANKRENS